MLSAHIHFVMCHYSQRQHAKYHVAEHLLLWVSLYRVPLCCVLILSVIIPSVIILSVIMLSILILSVIIVNVIMLYLDAECHHRDCHTAKCFDAECHYTECYYAECHYTECHYSERRGILSASFCRSHFSIPLWSQHQVSKSANTHTHTQKNFSSSKAQNVMRLCQPLDGSTSPKYKLLHF